MLVHSLAAAGFRLLRREDGDDGGEENCVYVEPGPNGNVPITACNSYYNYDPQFAPAVAVAVIFGVLTGIHVVEAFIYKKRFMWVLIMGALWETVAFILHSLGTRDQQQLGYVISWNLLFLLAPLWINAFAYMTFARMVHYWHPEGKVAGFRATAIAKWFVLADILSFIVQGVGGIMAGPDADARIIRIGLDIYLSGMGVQQFFIVVFVGLMVTFQVRCRRALAENPAGDGKRSWKPLLYALYAVLVFITIRIIFRLVEFTGGVSPETNPIPFHEEYIYALDCFPMMVALLILAIFHPGRYLVGPDSEFVRLSRKEKKAAKQAKKEAKRQAKEQKKTMRSKNSAEESDGAYV